MVRHPAPAPEAPLWAALRSVSDPELPVSLVDLGLVYAIRRQAGRVEVDLSFTATACPAMGMIQEDVRQALLQQPGVEEVQVRVVWDPPWTKERLTAVAREQLRRLGISV